MMQSTGQSYVLHTRSSGSGHCSPPYWPATCTFGARYWWPPPHVYEQSPQSPHVYLQSVGQYLFMHGFLSSVAGHFFPPYPAFE